MLSSILTGRTILGKSGGTVSRYLIKLCIESVLSSVERDFIKRVEYFLAGIALRSIFM